MFRVDFLYLFIILCIFLSIGSVRAAGPINVSDDGMPSAWDTSVDVPYNPEAGSCGPFSNITMLEKMIEIFANWTDLPDVEFTFEEVTGSIGQVNGDNFTSVLFLDSDSDANLLR